MKSKDIRKEDKKPKEKNVNGPSNVKYRIEYGKHQKATITVLDGALKGKSATYDGKEKKWSGINVPTAIKASIEHYFCD